MISKKAKNLGLTNATCQIVKLLKQEEHKSRSISIKAVVIFSLKSEKIPTFREGDIPASLSCCIIGLPKSNKT